jgi:hypothetical protein
MLWNTRKGPLLQSLGNATGTNWRFSPDNKVILTTPTEGSATIWDASDGKVMLKIAGPGLRTFEMSNHGSPKTTRLRYGTRRALYRTARSMLSLEAKYVPKIMTGSGPSTAMSSRGKL